ncbi:uridine kinase [Chromatocurvus halotolerans]|uniref:Uridine kinase n=1 Tax=Chromatocurvus halotolerans TaxID=1132028 RepID=A0A4R2KWR7_9GAMM|nr:uridine kinase [Chromatocurvus halotolerans]TCO78424.1 uridine kinase [Chromatocurvus halotolerans]
MLPCFIAIAGPSGSGKTLFAQTIRERVAELEPLLGLALIKEDAYYRDQSHLSLEAREKVNYDHPAALEQELLQHHLQCLRRGEAVDVPVYDYSQHTRAADVERVRPAPVVIVEGILLLSDPGLRAEFDIKFFVDTPLDICLLRRIARDMQDRGRTLESITEQYENTVRPMYYEFIQNTARYADMVITGGGRNAVALDVVGSMVLGLLRESPTADIKA